MACAPGWSRFITFRKCLARSLVGCLALIEQSSQVRTEFAADSLLEGGGFEPSVRRKRDSVFRCAPDRTPREILPAARLARRQSVLWSNHILSVKNRISRSRGVKSRPTCPSCGRPQHAGPL